MQVSDNWKLLQVRKINYSCNYDFLRKFKMVNRKIYNFVKTEVHEFYFLICSYGPLIAIHFPFENRKSKWIINCGRIMWHFLLCNLLQVNSFPGWHFSHRIKYTMNIECRSNKIQWAALYFRWDFAKSKTWIYNWTSFDNQQLLTQLKISFINSSLS
jgi:hypothetical protein